MMYRKKPSIAAPVKVFVPMLIVLSLLLVGCSDASPDTQNNSSSGLKTSGDVVVYFGNDILNPNAECDSVYPVARDVSDASNQPLALLRSLLSGPSDEEKVEGYSSFFSDNTADVLKSLSVQHKTAYVNLSDIRSIIPNASSSCGSAAFLAQIESTLTQFPDIDRVILAIDGDTQTLYDWLQFGCSDMNDNCNNEPFRSGEGE